MSNLNYFFQYCIIEESRASEAEKIDFSKNEAIKFWESKLNFWVKTEYKTGLIFWNWWNMVVKWPNLESDNSKNSKFSKFRFTAEFHIFFWKENAPHVTFHFKNKRVTRSWILRLLRPGSLWLCNIETNNSDSISFYLKDYLILYA